MSATTSISASARSEAFPSSSSISSPQDRIAILEDLIAFHYERNLHGVGEILQAVAYPGGANQPDFSTEVLRVRVAQGCATLTQLAHELAIGDLGAQETPAAMRRSQFVMSYPERLS